MQARFAVDDFGDEAAALKAAADGRAPEEAEHLWGRVVLEHAGQPAVAIQDDLSMLGLALCVDVPAALRREGRAELHLVGWPGEFSFAAEGANAVRVTGSQGEQAVFPKQALIDALHGCGQRLAAFMTELAGGSPQFGFSAKALVENLAAAGT